MRVLVTGAASLIGRNIVRYFLDRGCEVLALARENARNLDELKAIRSEKLELIMLDMNDIDSLDKKFDVCIHLAWAGIGLSGRMDLKIQNDNIENTQRLFRLCAELGCKKFIFAGSQAEYGQTLSQVMDEYDDFSLVPKLREDSKLNPKSEYGRAKSAVGEKLMKLAQELDITYIHTRIFSIYGRGDRETTLIFLAIKNLIENRDVIFGDCRQIWNYLYIEDMCSAMFLLAQENINESMVINLAGEDCRVLRDFVLEIKDVLDSTGNVMFEPREESVEGIPFLNPDIGKLRSIGFTEKYNFRSGVLDIVKDMI